MGQLAKQYGYYLAEWDLEKAGLDLVLGEAGEALMVIIGIDIPSCIILLDDTGTSAVWVGETA
jgi:hypothetical protein